MNELKADIYKILQQCVEEGIEGGWNKAMKNTVVKIGDGQIDYVKEQIEQYIMINICEKFKFD